VEEEGGWGEVHNLSLLYNSP